MDLGWRELVWLAVAGAGIYLLIALLALARTYGWRLPARNPGLPTDSVPERSASAVEFVFPPESVREPDEETRFESLDVPAMPAAAATDVGDAPFAATLAVTEVEREVRRLRDEVAALREEVAALRDMRRVSPLYADAAALAHRGFDARGVADECGISVAEAELVLAMSRDEKDFDSEVEDGDGRALDIAR